MNSETLDGSMEPNGQELRQRKGPEAGQAANGDKVNVQQYEPKGKKTYGRTAGGTVFIVPQTRDMVSQLFSPSQPKNISDLILVAFLGLHILTLYLLPPSLRIPAFAVIFVTWRAGYNLGIGILLHLQSKHWSLVNWAKQYKLFVNPQTGKSPHPRLYKFMQSELERKIPVDYKFAEAPIEYNTWLVFRRVVDIILLCDFVSYCLFAIACAGRPSNESVILTIARWAAGLTLFGFNLWVKLDAHRVVKDFAWYWGDFFFLIDQELTFDGVFEMAPHPMYSIGYAGYYGISLMAASYRVLVISILAHAAQFAFLLLVENPHIDKTYNPPPRRRRSGTTNAQPELDVDPSESNPELPTITENPDPPTSIHNLLGVGSIDLHRVTDTSVLILQTFMFALTVLTPSTRGIKSIFVINAVVWRLWYSLGIGYILNRQSLRKRWTRHFLKYGGSTAEAWREWKGIYHLSMTMCYASFLAASFKLYQRPADWTEGLPILKHVVGVGLIALHLWTAFSIYDSLGDFGWFFGDFFFTDQRPTLTYSGIYRFLNNPERVIGLAGVWGLALITGSTTIFFLALLSQVLALAFIQFVERPHMQRTYGHGIRQESGLTRSLRRSLPPSFFGWQGSVDKILEGTFESVEELIDTAKPKLAAGVSLFVRDTKSLFKYPARISITRLSPDIAGYDPLDYSVQLTGLSPNPHSNAINVAYGTPLRIKWTAPLNHSKSDWIGLYRVADNSSREITGLPSNGRWIPTNKDKYGSIVADSGILSSDIHTSGASRKDGESKDYYSGEMQFSGDKLWWRTGVFELRYHHNGKHRVMAISLPFEITIERFDEDDITPDVNGGVRAGVEQALLKLVRNCFDRDEDIAPHTVDEGFGGQVERDGKYPKRVVYAMQQMFGIEFAPEVVQADGNVRNLAWRVCHAKKALQQYSSLSRGRNSPVDSKY